MSRSWKNWEGQNAGGQYVLGPYLGGSDHSAVFLTRTTGAGSHQAAIKLISPGSGNPQEKLSEWRAASGLLHGNLLRILDSGQAEISGTPVLFVVTNYAEEDLSQILPTRALTAEETQGMLTPVLEALLFLHQKDLVHGSLKPSNILASGDRILLSGDSIRRSGRKRGAAAGRSPHDAPEEESSPAADVWSLGMSLVEILTQRLPVSDPSRSADPLVPDSVPAPFLEIARNCLKRDREERWSIVQILFHLDPHSAEALAALAAAKPQPKPAPPPESAPAKAREAHPPVNVSRLSPVEPLPERERRAAQRFASGPAAAVPWAPRRALQVGIAAVLLLALAGVAKWMRQDSSASRSVSAAPETPPANPAAAPAGHRPGAKNAETARTEPRRSEPAAKPADPALEPASRKEPVRSVEPRVATARPGDASRGEVLEQVLPQISAKSRNTIHGVVRVAVKVHVDESGLVTLAELETLSSSKYFSDQALAAAKRWTFQPPEVGGRPVASDWRLNFNLSPTDTRATPSQLAP